MNIQTIITAAGRKTDTLTKTVDSLISSGGKDILISCEPDTEINFFHDNTVTLIERDEQLGCWRNWVQSLYDAMIYNPEAEAIFIVQDDIVFCKDVYKFLETYQWPSPKCGLLSVCSSSQYHRLPLGFAEVENRPKWAGATALLIPRHVAYQIIADVDVYGWGGVVVGAKPSEIKGIDPWLGQVMQRMNREMWICNPSLGNHIGDESTLGHGPNTGNRVSLNFPGEEVSALDLDNFSPGYYLPTGDPVGSLKPIHVIIPCAGESYDLLEECIPALSKVVCPLKVSLFSNGSESTNQWYKEKSPDYPSLEIDLHMVHENLGFTRANNYLLDKEITWKDKIYSKDEYHRLLLNSDCVVSENVIPLLVNSLHYDESIFAVGPLSDDFGFQSLRNRNRVIQSALREDKLLLLVGNDLTPENSDTSSSVVPSDPSYYLPKNSLVKEPMVAFFCTLLRNTSIDKVGLLSNIPEFESGLGADDEWCLRARNLGYRICVQLGAFASHKHSETFKRMKIDRMSLQKVAINKYHELAKN